MYVKRVYSPTGLIDNEEEYKSEIPKQVNKEKEGKQVTIKGRQVIKEQDRYQRKEECQYKKTVSTE